MVTERSVKDRFLDEVAGALRQWAALSSTRMTDPAADLRATDIPEAYRICQGALREAGVDPAIVKLIIEDALCGFAHSLFCTIDGATTLSDDGRAVVLVDDNGENLAPALHEEFALHFLGQRPKPS